MSENEAQMSESEATQLKHGIEQIDHEYRIEQLGAVLEYLQENIETLLPVDHEDQKIETEGPQLEHDIQQYNREYQIEQRETVLLYFEGNCDTLPSDHKGQEIESDGSQSKSDIHLNENDNQIEKHKLIERKDSNMIAGMPHKNNLQFPCESLIRVLDVLILMEDILQEAEQQVLQENRLSVLVVRVGVGRLCRCCIVVKKSCHAILVYFSRKHIELSS